MRMNSKRILVVATATILLFTTVVAAKQKKAAPAGSSVFAQDKGKFTIQLNGQTVGHEDFDISAAGAAWATHSTTDLKALDAPASRVTGTLMLQPDGAPISYQWISQAGTAMASIALSFAK